MYGPRIFFLELPTFSGSAVITLLVLCYKFFLDTIHMGVSPGQK